jgi:hypothetical protein
MDDSFSDDVCVDNSPLSSQPAPASTWNPTSSADCERQADSLLQGQNGPSGWNKSQLIRMCEGAANPSISGHASASSGPAADSGGIFSGLF